jgi:hypothetical protein
MEGIATHFITSNWVQEWGNPLVEEIEQEWEVDYECAAECFYVVLL